MPRPSIVGPDAGPEPPFPVRMEGPVISGFGRGSKELGIPTANLPVDAAATPWIAGCASGVYFGWAVLEPARPGEAAAAEAGGVVGDRPSKLPAAPADIAEVTGPVTAAATTPAEPPVLPMVMSIGYNPFYQNTTRTAEVHILHKFAGDFYGAHLRLALLGYVRPELDYVSLEALVADIRFDCDVARRSLARPAWTPAGQSTALAGAASIEGGAVEEAAVDGTLSIPWLLG